MDQLDFFQINFNTTQSTGTLFHLQTSTGGEILTFSPAKAYRSVVFSSAALQNGTNYDVYLGGISTGNETDGLYQSGSYKPGNPYKNFTISGMATTLGTR